MDLLNTLSASQLDELTKLLDERRREQAGKKIDFDHMSDIDRWNFNKTIHPITQKGEHIDYPRALYGMKDGQVVTVTVADESHELVIREQYDYDWKYSMAEHGIETLPTHGDGIKPVDFGAPQGVTIVGGLPPAEFAQGLARAQEKAAANGQEASMTPMHQWIAVRPTEKVASSFLWVPGVPANSQCKIGTIESIGPGRLMKGRWHRPMPVVPGQRVLYSSRVDQYQVGDDQVDVIEDDSIIGVMHDDRG